MKDIFLKRPYLNWGYHHEIGCSNGGEDNFVMNYFKDNLSNKIVVDIGAADGITGSNSYRLISECGWSAILIEPFKPFYNFLLELHKNNDKVKILNYACDNEEKQTVIKYRSFDEHMGLTSLLCDWENSQNIETKKFNTLVETKKIHFLSLDTEGKDFDILKDINFNEYDIEVICSEKSDDLPHYNNNIIQFLQNKNYVHHLTTNHNFIFVKK